LTTALHYCVHYTAHYLPASVSSSATSNSSKSSTFGGEHTGWRAAPNLTRNTHPQATVLIPEPTGDDLAIATLPQPEPASQQRPASGVCHPCPTVQQRYKQLLQRSDTVEYMPEYGLRYVRADEHTYATQNQTIWQPSFPCPCLRLGTVVCLSSPGTILLPLSLSVGHHGIGSAATIAAHVLYCRYHTQDKVLSPCT
jgi:hypothetical protein